MSVATAAARVAPGSRQPGLDFLRAAAIGWVLLYHASLFGLAPRDPWIVKFGWMGVDLFFALSGYLIAGQLLRPLARGQRPDYRRFLVRRLLRTLPAYFAVLAVYFLVAPARDRPDLLPLWRFLTFTQNIGLVPDPPKAFSHAWSLCVEEQFYLALPVALLPLAPRATPRRVLAVFVGTLVFGMAVRGWLWLDQVALQPHDPASAPRALRYMTAIYYPSWSRLDGLLAGVAAAALQIFRPAWWGRLVQRCNLVLLVGFAGVVVSAAVFGGQIAGFYGSVLGFPLLSLSMGALVIGASATRSVAAGLAGPAVRALAAGSYSLYLSHKIAYHAAEAGRAAWPGTPLGLWVAVGLAGALALGAALHWLVERPFLRLRDRLDGQRPAPRPEVRIAAE